MLVAWLITLPSAGLVAALTWAIGHVIGGLAGAVVIFVMLIAFAVYMFVHSRKNPVGHHNVTDEWDSRADEALPVVPAETTKEVAR
jgi:PiT family inorganic phosphate transporter